MVHGAGLRWIFCNAHDQDWKKEMKSSCRAGEFSVSQYVHNATPISTTSFARYYQKSGIL